MDIQQAFDAGFDAVKAYVDNIADEFEARIKAIETRPAVRGETGERGAPGADGVPGKDGIGLAEIIREADGNLIAVLSDGRTKSIGNIAVRDGVDGKDGRDGIDGKDGSPGLNGKDADMDAIQAMIDEAVERRVAEAVSEIPVPKDGKDGRDGADGVGLAGAVQDAEGNLVITDTKGGVHKVGRVRGMDGKDGDPGLDGAAGKDGRDGFSLDDFDATLMEDGRTVLLSFGAGDTAFKVELGIPAMIYRGVFRDGQTYEKGDTVTWGGSLWHCDVDNTTTKPDSAEKHWTLAAKRGRDGRDGSPGERGERGAEGRPGRDLTQMGLNGEKW